MAKMQYLFGIVASFLGVYVSKAQPPLAFEAKVALYFAFTKYGCFLSFPTFQPACNLTQEVFDCFDSSFDDIPVCETLNGLWNNLEVVCSGSTPCDCYQGALNIISTNDALSVVDKNSQFYSCSGSLDCSLYYDMFSSIGLPPIDYATASCSDELELMEDLIGTETCNLTCPSNAPSPQSTTLPPVESTSHQVWNGGAMGQLVIVCLFTLVKIT